MKALISIDYTNDFVAADGALTTGEPGQAIEEALVEITRTFTENGDFVIYGIDRHDKDDAYHPESKLFPPHNLAGTKGRELFGGLKPLYEETKNQENVYWIDKRHYSAFSGTDLDIRLRERQITEIHLTGVCTDICVLHTAVDAYNLGYQLVIHKSAVASFDQAGHEWALRHFANTLGAEIVD
ncbi:cysteine hydrolase family protein [Enterococcus sp. LJL128]|uniref:cysteine hydrolase family protein n=1 Tax=Enterococcus sp. LJL51 TaxID=3416656 RepID=UPI003CF5670C